MKMENQCRQSLADSRGTSGSPYQLTNFLKNVKKYRIDASLLAIIGQRCEWDVNVNV